MTNIIIHYNGDCVNRIEAKGHTDYAPSGSDIVCAGISTLLQTAVLSVRKMFDIDIVETLCDGNMVLNIPNNKEVQIIINSIIYGLRDIESGYPKNLRIKEIRDVY